MIRTKEQRQKEILPILKKMNELGFDYLEDDSISARNSVSRVIASWFLNTIMIFQKK